MRWIDKLERRWGRYGIPNLMNIILVGQLIAWVIVMVINQNFYYAITLNRTALMSGQIWRVVTFLFVPPLSTGIQLLLTLYFRWWVGNSLQRAWGDFRYVGAGVFDRQLCQQGQPAVRHCRVPGVLWW